MTQPNMLDEQEERELRDKWGYDDSEIEMVSQSRLYGKMADDLRAQAAQSALNRRSPKAQPRDGADG